MHPMENRRTGTINRAFIPQNSLSFQKAVSSTTFNNGGKNYRHFAKLNQGSSQAERPAERHYAKMEEPEPMQFCNLKENILRLEELANRNGISLDDDSLDNRQYLFQELCDVNPNANAFARNDSLGSTCWFDAGRRFSGFKPEHLLDEHSLAQLVYQFGLEHMRELPVLHTETIHKYLLAVESF